VQSTLGVGGCDNICLGHVLVAVRQGQRRDAAATGEEQLDRFTARKSKYIQLYLYSGELIFAAAYLRRVFVDGRSHTASQNLTRPSYRFFGLNSKLFSKVQIDLKRGLGSIGVVTSYQSVTTESHNFSFGVGEISAESPCIVATFIVNSERYTGARPSIRLCVGLVAIGSVF
jgi:hypothetical protein